MDSHMVNGFVLSTMEEPREVTNSSYNAAMSYNSSIPCVRDYARESQ